jgi:hypothetical protein
MGERLRTVHLRDTELRKFSKEAANEESATLAKPAEEVSVGALLYVLKRGTRHAT